MRQLCVIFSHLKKIVVIKIVRFIFINHQTDWIEQNSLTKKNNVISMKQRLAVQTSANETIITPKKHGRVREVQRAITKKKAAH